ncbi:MAG: metallophosphoesterase family protein [Janthinobacterium lividum]
MTRAPLLLQISDPHFGTEVPTVVRALERLAHEQAPDVLVLSGDITQRATRRQFADARAFVDGLGIPDVLAIPGNHDIPLFQLGARLLSPYARYAGAFGEDMAPMFESEAWLVLGVNTTRWYRHEDGEVSEAQISRVAERLARARPGQVRVVVTHQPVMATRPEDASNRLHGRDAAVVRWSAAGADLVLGGHIHLPFVQPLGHVVPGCPRALWAVQAGTAVSSRVRSGAPNSVNLIRQPRTDVPDAPVRACVVERWDYSADGDCFARVASHALPLDTIMTTTTASRSA